MKTGSTVEDTRPVEPTYQRALPAWITSLVVHASLILILAITIQVVPRGVSDEPDRTTGIVLKHVGKTGEYYEGEQDDRDEASESVRSTSNAVSVAAALPQASDSPLEPSSFLPSSDVGLGPPAGAIGGGGNLGLDGSAPGSRNIKGGRARTGVFGLYGEGYKFVYVFDASDSMNSNGGRPLAAAKRELASSLQSLGRLQQFQIIFYNEQQRVFNPTGIPGKLFFATDANKESAASFINSVSANVATEHLPALKMALRMGPDVIFFLTDGEEPALSRSELKSLQRMNKGNAAIHVIQFGTTKPSSNNWLMRLARQNHGEFAFFNIRRLSPKR